LCLSHDSAKICSQADKLLLVRSGGQLYEHNMSIQALGDLTQEGAGPKSCSVDVDQLGMVMP
jgi:hypothetical protein